MNTFKKIWLGIIALVVLIPSLLVLSPVAFAASDCGNQSVCLDQQFWDGATYTLQSQNEINVSNGPTRVQFQKAAGNTYDASPLDSLQINGLCGGSSQNTIKLNSPDFSQPTLTGTLSVQYSITSSNQQNQSQVDCTTYSKSLSGSSSITNLTANGSGGTCTYAACSNSDITNSLKSLNLTSDPSQITGTFINGKTVTFTDGAVSDTHHTYSAPIGTFCSGGGGLGSVTIDDGDYQKILSAKENPVPGILDVDWYNATDKSCNNYTPGNTTAVNIDTTAYLASISPGAKCSPPGATQGNLICGGTDNTACTSQGCTWATATVSAGSNNSCESSYTGAAHEFNWISCKILAGLDGLTNTFLGIVQNQLDVCTGTSSTTGNTCSNNILTDKVKQAWRIFRVIATSILVIILLVMVISQAIGSGPFDAYTLRKVLPRLVAIAIFMQISWYVFKFVIDVSNDVGVGIAQLMYFPFGGAGKMSLDNLIGGVGVLAPGFTITALFTGIVVGYIAGGLTIFGVIFLGASAVISLIIGLLVLLFRQILIILLMIFVPIALVAWILPGTQRYWKLWQDNFMKILFMFPLITAMIAGGRIFAFVGATKGVLGLFVVLLGFFGPLWFLPKTFKWGGQAFGALSTGTLAATRSMRGYPSKYALAGAKDTRAQRALARANRLATSEPGNRRMLDRLLSGEFNVARGQAARGRHFERTLAEGEKEAREGVGAALLRVGYENMRHGPAVDAQGNRIQPGQAGYEINKLDALQAWLEGREYAGVTPDEALMGHAFDELAKLGDPDRIRAARRNSHGHEAMWTKAMARNFPRMNEIARDFTLAPDLTNLSPRQYSTQDADTANELFLQVDQGYIMNRETGQQTWLAPQERQAQRQRAVDFADEVFNNELIYGDLGPDHRRVIDQLRTMRDPNDIAVVQGARKRGTTDRAALPEGQVLAAQPQAQANLVQALADPARSPVVAAEFARQLDDPAQRPAYEQFLRTRVQAHNTPAAVAMNTRLRQAHQSHIDQQMAAYEQTLLAQGMQPAAVQNLVTTARQRADQDHQALFP